mmetsp:Transcript_51184/g.125709  ORF Transcript_51184/g.125709 Transcript_51184/m.125709 type:complete len:150 (-) Transcript_51184:397-846(-)
MRQGVSVKKNNNFQPRIRETSKGVPSLRRWNMRTRRNWFGDTQGRRAESGAESGRGGWKSAKRKWTINYLGWVTVLLSNMGCVLYKVIYVCLLRVLLGQVKAPLNDFAALQACDHGIACAPDCANLVARLQAAHQLAIARLPHLKVAEL